MIIKEEIMKQLPEDPQIYLNAGCDLYGDHYSLVPKSWY